MQPTSSQEALAQLQAQQGQSQNPNQILQYQQQQLGVPAAQETLTGLRGAINNTTKLLKQVAPSVMGRAANSLVTQAQATRQIQNERAPLTETLGEQGGQYNEANLNLNELSKRAGESASGIYTGQQDKLSYLQNLYNTLYGREQDEINRAEDTRRFNEQQATARRGSGGGGSSFNLSDEAANSTTQGGADNPIKAKAVADVDSLLERKGTKDFYDEVRAIAQSAGYGNTYDQAKLELLQTKQPGLFKNGQLDTGRITRLINSGRNTVEDYRSALASGGY